MKKHRGRTCLKETGKNCPNTDLLSHLPAKRRKPLFAGGLYPLQICDNLRHSSGHTTKCAIWNFWRMETAKPQCIRKGIYARSRRKQPVQHETGIRQNL